MNSMYSGNDACQDPFYPKKNQKIRMLGNEENVPFRIKFKPNKDGSNGELLSIEVLTFPKEIISSFPQVNVSSYDMSPTFSLQYHLLDYKKSRKGKHSLRAEKRGECDDFADRVLGWSSELVALEEEINNFNPYEDIATQINVLEQKIINDDNGFFKRMEGSVHSEQKILKELKELKEKAQPDSDRARFLQKRITILQTLLNDLGKDKDKFLYYINDVRGKINDNSLTIEQKRKYARKLFSSTHESGSKKQPSLGAFINNQVYNVAKAGVDCVYAVEHHSFRNFFKQNSLIRAFSRIKNEAESRRSIHGARYTARGKIRKSMLDHMKAVAEACKNNNNDDRKWINLTKDFLSGPNDYETLDKIIRTINNSGLGQKMPFWEKFLKSLAYIFLVFLFIAFANIFDLAISIARAALNIVLFSVFLIIAPILAAICAVGPGLLSFSWKSCTQTFGKVFEAVFNFRDYLSNSIEKFHNWFSLTRVFRVAWESAENHGDDDASVLRKEYANNIKNIYASITSEYTAPSVIGEAAVDVSLGIVNVLSDNTWGLFKYSWKHWNSDSRQTVRRGLGRKIEAKLREREKQFFDQLMQKMKKEIEKRKSLVDDSKSEKDDNLVCYQKYQAAGPWKHNEMVSFLDFIDEIFVTALTDFIAVKNFAESPLVATVGMMIALTSLGTAAAPAVAIKLFGHKGVAIIDKITSFFSEKMMGEKLADGMSAKLFATFLEWKAIFYLFEGFQELSGDDPRKFLDKIIMKQEKITFTMFILLSVGYGVGYFPTLPTSIKIPGTNITIPNPYTAAMNYIITEAHELNNNAAPGLSGLTQAFIGLKSLLFLHTLFEGQHPGARAPLITFGEMMEIFHDPSINNNGDIYRAALAQALRNKGMILDDKQLARLIYIMQKDDYKNELIDDVEKIMDEKEEVFGKFSGLYENKWEIRHKKLKRIKESLVNKNMNIGNKTTDEDGQLIEDINNIDRERIELAQYIRRVKQLFNPQLQINGNSKHGDIVLTRNEARELYNELFDRIESYNKKIKKAREAFRKLNDTTLTWPSDVQEINRKRLLKPLFDQVCYKGGPNWIKIIAMTAVAPYIFIALYRGIKYLIAWKTDAHWMKEEIKKSFYKEGAICLQAIAIGARFVGKGLAYAASYLLRGIVCVPVAIIGIPFMLYYGFSRVAESVQGFFNNFNFFGYGPHIFKLHHLFDHKNNFLKKRHAKLTTRAGISPMEKLQDELDLALYGVSDNVARNDSSYGQFREKEIIAIEYGHSIEGNNEDIIEEENTVYNENGDYPSIKTNIIVDDQNKSDYPVQHKQNEHFKVTPLSRPLMQ